MLSKLKWNDEVFVWLSALGLCVGTLSVLYLLTVIFLNGLSIFWPKDIHAFTLDSGETYLGEKVKMEDKLVRTPQGSGLRMNEIQYFLGNKDVLGINFKYVLEKEIKEFTNPNKAIEIERTEYGALIGFPKELQFKDGQVILFGSKNFEKALKLEKQRTTKNRKKINDLEKNDIGRVSYNLEKLEVRRNKLKKESARDDATELQKIEEETAALQKKYHILAEKALQFRTAQNENTLVLTIPNGSYEETKSLPTGNIIDYHYPNEMNFFQKSFHFVHGVFNFLVNDPREANTEGGVFPAIFGTFVMTILMSAAVMPFGVIAAVYLHEYAKQGLFVRTVRIAVNNLAGVPSIVFGVFGLGFFIYILGERIDHWFFYDRLPAPTFGTGGILWASLTLAFMTVPVVIVATEESLAAVPRAAREGALACGASKWQTISSVVLPAAAPGMLTGLILAMARGAGEVAPLMLVGVVKLAPTLPLDTYFPFFHLERKFMHLGFHIYDLGFQSPDSEAVKPMVFATTLLLIALVVMMNLGAIYIRGQLKKKYKTSAF